MKITKEDIILNGITIAKGSPWIKYLIKKINNEYFFIEKDGNFNMSTILFSSTNLNEVINYINNFFGKQFLILEEVGK